MFQYFLKVVSTRFRNLDGQIVVLLSSLVLPPCLPAQTSRSILINTALRILSETSLKVHRMIHHKASTSHMVSLACQVIVSNIPARPNYPDLLSRCIFQFRDIPVARRSFRNPAIICPLCHIVSSLFHSVSSLTYVCRSYRTCAIVGGVLTVTSLVDSLLFATGRVLRKTASGVGSSAGKLM